MKAIVFEKYGPPEVLQIKEVEKPALKDNQVLVKIHAASANALDWRRFTLPTLFIRLMEGGLLKPKDTTLGADMAGRVEAVGEKVTQYKPGDEVFGVARGAFAEYACTAEKNLVLKPANLSFEAAAAVPIAALTALQGLRDAGHIRAGQKVLIQGAGGGVGTFAVQIAKSYGTEVTAVCGPRNQEVAHSIGADHVIDYTREDFTRSGQRYDLILAVNGYHPITAYRRALTSTGTYVAAGGSLAQIFQTMLLSRLISRVSGQQIVFMGLAKVNHEDLAVLKEFLQARKIVPVIDRRYALNEVPEAVRYLVEGHPKGKVVIILEH